MVASSIVKDGPHSRSQRGKRQRVIRPVMDGAACRKKGRNRLPCEKDDTPERGQKEACERGHHRALTFFIFGCGDLPIKERMAEETNLSLEDFDQLLGTDSEKASASELDALTQDLLGGGPTPAASDAGLDQDQLNTIADFLGSSSPSAEPVEAMSFGASRGEEMSGDQGKKNFPLLLDVNVRFIVELGRTQMYIKDVMLLSEGSIVELDKNVGDDVDLLVNDRLFGRGRLVVVDEFYAVQITQIVNPMTAYRNL